MIEPLPPRPSRKPRKIVSDETRAQELLEQLQRAELDIREATERRAKLALAANEIGVTTTKIGEAVGVSHAAASKWIRAARERRETDAKR
ncbi:helix-turn-helix domain-containing protein [Leifsonia sp. NPDC014704]|uniref:helix-turn-helix domain-containing protein n=1 Tax=Leifsonia sp. NPDC014704 TaxID=3364123 RepID=UPI0036F4906B